MFHVKHRRLCFTWNFYLDVRFHVERSALLGLARAFHVNLCFERDLHVEHRVRRLCVSSRSMWDMFHVKRAA